MRMVALSLSYADGTALMPLKTAVMPIRPPPPPPPSKHTAPALYDAHTVALPVPTPLALEDKGPQEHTSPRKKMRPPGDVRQRVNA